MKRRTSTLPVRVYQYGVGEPTSGGELLDQQMFIAHRHKNALVEIWRIKREALREEQASVLPLEEEKNTLVARREELRAAIGRTRSAARKRIPVSAEIAEQLDVVNAELKAKRELLRDAKAVLWSDPEFLERVKKIDEDHKQRVKDCQHRFADGGQQIDDCKRGCPKNYHTARQITRCAEECNKKRAPLYWGNYLADEADLDPLGRLPLKEEMDPGFHRWNGRGRSGIQFQGGLDVADLFNGRGTLMQIDPIPEDTFEHDEAGRWKKTRGERRRASRTTVRFRVGSDEKGHPIWVEMPMVLHRPLPEGGRIKEARILRKKIASHHRMVLQMRIEADYNSQRPHGEGMLALDLGWRSGNQLRIGYWYDGTSHRPVTLPESIPEALSHVESLRSIRDRNFNEMRAWFCAWKKGKDFPEWLESMTETIAAWKSPGRLAKVALVWRGKRWNGDKGGYQRLEGWRKQDKHLWEWEANERHKTLGHRLEEYRQFALWAFKHYACVALEDFDLRRVAELREPEKKEKEPHKEARHNRVVAAVSTLRLAIKNAATSCGGTIKLVPPEYTTLQCHVCGFIEKWDAAPQVMHTCSNCGATWDQDHNGAVNIYRRAQEPDETEQPKPDETGADEAGTVPTNTRVPNDASRKVASAGR
jgi:hypothetical protein